MNQQRDTTRNSRPLAIAGASARAAAASAVRAGFQPLAADLFADADLRRIATATRISPYPEGLLDWLRAVEPPAWMYTGALENHPELVDQMAWVAPLWGNPGDVLERVRSPLKLADALRSAGLLFPETRTSPEDLPVDGSWLAKTYRGASGSGVREWDQSGRRGEGESGRQTDDPRSVESPGIPRSANPAFCYQRRVPGTPCAAVFVAHGGSAQLLGVTRQLVGEGWLGAHGFQYAGSIGPWPVSEVALATVKKLGDVLAKEFELIGLFGVDLVIDGDDVWTIEVNPRYTASVEIVERATGICAVRAHADACTVGQGARDGGLREMDIGSRQSPASSRRFHGKAILFAKHDVIISDSFAAFSLADALQTPWPAVADVSTAGTLIEAGRPVLSVFAEGQSSEDVERQLRQHVAQFEKDLYSGN